MKIEKYKFDVNVMYMYLFVGCENRDLDILIFREVLDNIVRVDRVLIFLGGFFLMVGRSGVGRRIVVLLVVYMYQMYLFFFKVFRVYGMKQFKNDLKIVSQKWKMKEVKVICIFRMEKLLYIFKNYIFYVYCFLNFSVEIFFFYENMYMKIFRMKVECKYKYICIV